MQVDLEKERRKNEAVNKVRDILEVYLLEHCEDGDTISAEILFPGDKEGYFVGSTKNKRPSNK